MEAARHQKSKDLDCSPNFITNSLCGPRHGTSSLWTSVHVYKMELISWGSCMDCKKWCIENIKVLSKYDYFWDIAQGGRELDLLLIFWDEVMLSPVLKFKGYENTKSHHPCLFTTQQSSLIWPMLPASWALDEFRRSKRKWSVLSRTSVEAIEACFGVILKGMCREGNEEGISGQEMWNKHLGIKKPGI